MRAIANPERVVGGVHSGRGRILWVHLALLITVAVWGINAVVVKAALVELPAASLAMARHFVASTAFLLMLPILGARPSRLPVRDLPWLFFVGFLAVSSGITIPFGQEYIPAGITSLVTTTSPVFTAVLSVLFLRERLGLVRVGGIALAVAGLAVIFLAGNPEAGLGSTNVLGFLLVLAAPTSWSIYTVAGKPLLERYPPLVATAYGLILGTIAYLPLTPSSLLSDLAALSIRGWGLLMYTGLGPLVVGYGLWFYALRRLQPTQVAVYMYLVPLFGVGSAGLLASEPITMSVLAGGAAIIGGVVLANLQKSS